ncbi:alpha/beta hydrolase family protein [Aporhodopirellula aestuarii]|uniref:Dienelactone hydrolase family protein n=1 Tax=Aporhodopirellula aestuarii TaxID=2950107 RepID=A0ABT0UFK9_9BACT|nr:dienelactone hydrolase family protein [Aporhodopirellula aestuarii]MCM2374906.1 dienelactone hydrolase family protein [Aporhodopirellula aestuarii]
MIARTPLLLMSTLLAAMALPQEALPQTMTPPEIWAGYDPRAEPLDEEVLKTWTEDGVAYKEVYFNGEQLDGDYVRIYGIYAAPVGGKNLPAIVHIHGGGQTVNKYWLKELTSRGYAVLTFNWGGKWPGRERYTLWNDVPNGNHKDRVGHQITLPTPRSDSYYLWTQASMRAITYLENQSEVAPEKIGAFGVSMGGAIMWNLAFDPRIKAGCAIYGVGWNTYRHYDPRFAIGHPGHTPSDNDLRWRASLAPEASAPYVKFPMLFLSGSNDHHGDMDRAGDTLERIPEGVPRCWALTPRFRHHIGADFVEDLPLWMDVHLKNEGVWPENPLTQLSLGSDGVPVLTLNPDRPQEVRQIEVYYALENPFSVNRNWRTVTVENRDGSVMARTSVMNADKYLFAFANITYASGAVISSPLLAVIPSSLGEVTTTAAPSRKFYDGSDGLDGWVCSSPGTDPIPALARTPLKVATGPNGLSGFTTYERGSPFTYAPGDPEFRAPRGASLSFDIKTTTGESFAVKLHKNYRVLDSGTWSSTVNVDPNEGWQTVTLDGDSFIDEKTGTPLGDSINETNVLELALEKGTVWQDKEILFSNFRWVGGEYVPHVHAYRDTTKHADVETHSSDDAADLVDHEAVKSESLIENAAFHSENIYRIEPGGFRKGAVLWTDRPYRVTAAPAELDGADLIQTPMVDRSNGNSDLVTFRVQKNCTVYVGMKESDKHPAWISGWEKTDWVVEAGNRMVCYRKTFDAGRTVVLGGGRGLQAMYTVVIKEPSSQR